MHLTKTYRFQLAAALAGMALVLAWGCGGDEGYGRRYPVSGTVIFKGAPVETGQINFAPTTKEGRAANGDIENGKYKLTTVNPGDGALPGSYRVSIVSKFVDQDVLSKTSRKEGGTARPQDIMLAGTKYAKNMIPAKYQLVDTSGLTATVKEGPNAIDFDLKE
jgi:hypothetical protein